jgi:fatty acid desaturase
VATGELQPIEGKLSHADYIRALRPLLPEQAFQPYPRAYVAISVHLAIIVLGWIACRTASWVWWPPISLIIANSMSSLSFLAHDVAHRSVTRNRYLLYPTELILWSLMFLPATLWRRLHTAHHIHTNTTKDPDRRFLPCELSPVGKFAAAALFPSARLRFNPTYWLYWVFFPFRHGAVAFFYGGQKAEFVTATPRYAAFDKYWIVFELVFILVFQFSIALFVSQPFGLVAVSLVPVCLTSAVASWYFFTNHGLQPVDDGDDVLAVTTTVTVPPICNRLHSNFAYHTEHHLFPGMNPIYYPLVGQLLKRRFPVRYNHLSIFEAWSALLRNPLATDQLKP